MNSRTTIGCHCLLFFVVGCPLWVSGCKSGGAPHNESVQLDLRKLGASPASVKFEPVRTYGALPQGVRERIGSKVSNPNGLFNPSDMPTPGMPDRRMIFAYKSDNFCLIEYEKGGIAHEFILALFEVSDSQATPRWARSGKRIDNIAELRRQLDQAPPKNEVDEIIW